MAIQKKNVNKKNSSLYYTQDKELKGFEKTIKTIFSQFPSLEQQKILEIIAKNPNLRDSIFVYLNSKTFFSPLKEEKFKSVNLYETKKIDLLINNLQNITEEKFKDKTDEYFKKLSSNKIIDDFLEKWDAYENEENINKNDIVKMSVKKIELTDISDVSKAKKSLKRINIAIDGPSGVGKSTISKILAKKLKYTFISTGKMYRTYAYNIYKNNIQLTDNPSMEEQVINLWSEDMIEYFSEDEILLNKRNVASMLNNDEIAMIASKIAKIQKVREFLVEYQQKLALKKGVIMEGRDITFKVLPDAELKIFLTANKEIRAKRRYEELKLKNPNTNYENVLEDLIQRDLLDTTREIDPLQKTEDSVEIDSSNKNIEEIVDFIYELAIFKENELNNE